MSLNQDSNASHDAVTKNKVAVNLFLLLVSVYIVTSSGNTVDVTDDGMVRYAVTERLVEQGSFALPEDMDHRWGVRGQDGSYYTNHGLGESLLAIPFYWAGKLLGNPKFSISLLGPVVSALSCVVLFALALRLGYSVKTGAGLSLLAGLCTQIWPESKSPFDHHMETLLVLACVYQMVAFLEDRRRWQLWLAGASLGFAVMTRVTTVLWLLPLSLFFWASCRDEPLWKDRVQVFLQNGAWFLLGFVPWMAFVFWYNAFRFGSVFEAGYSLWAAQRNIVNFGNPIMTGLAGELVSPGKGVLLYCPVFLLTLLGAKRFLTWRREMAWVCIVASIIYLLFFAKYRAWHGDNAWGPRYLTFLMPYWILFAGAFLRPSAPQGNVLRQGVVNGIICISFLFQLAGVMIDMNLHYMRLLRTGVIQNVETYAYPPRVHFEVQYSPLLDRFHEVARALRWITPSQDEASLPTVAASLPAVDFWWLQSSSTGAVAAYGWLLVCPFFFEAFVSGYRIRKLVKACDLR